MMFCVLRPTGLSLRATLYLGAALLCGGAAGAQTKQDAQGWNPRLETDAEFAYRSVYERVLGSAKTKQAQRPPSHPAATAVTASGPAPALPERRERQETDIPIDEAVTIAPVTEEPEASPPERIAETVPAQPPAWQALSDPLDEALIQRPNSLYDVLTTQVTGDGQSAAPVDQRSTPRDRGEQYCANIADAASDARFAWQKQTLVATEKQIEERLRELNAKIAEYQKWIERRDEFSRKAQATISSIYGKMRPDAAAQQLMALDEETAAAVITQLNPRVSSALMAEMDAKQAARLTAIISASGKGPKGKPPAKPQGGGT